MKKTKIICSIGPSSVPVDVMKKMVEGGMNVARINFSHATLEEKQADVASVKEVRKLTGQPIAILYDTKGPEFRGGLVENDSIELVEGETIKIVKSNIVGTKEAISVNQPQALDSLKVGDYVLLVNGLLKVQVTSIIEDGIECKIINGGILGSRKSICAPGVRLNIPFMSDADKEDIIYACEHDGDFIALSFVTCKEDVLEARELVKEHGREDIKLIAKIESQTAYDKIDEIIEVADGVMVGRGDLGDEIEIGKLPIYQKNIIRKCREKGKFVIVATEMMESMMKNARPTRAEVSDVSNAVFDGTDAVMLSGETTLGNHPIGVVKFMGKISQEADENYKENNQVFDYEYNDTCDLVAKSVVSAAEDLNVKVIVAATMSGFTARKISNLKPDAPILATVPNEKVARSLVLNWGVYPVVTGEYASTDELVEDAVKRAKEFVELKKGDKILITGGFPNTGVKTTNFMKIEEIK